MLYFWGFTQKYLIFPLGFFLLICQYVDMHLPLNNTKVVNSRFFKGQNVVWRRRQTNDGLVFTTRERIDLTGLMVKKNNNRAIESYSPVKLLLSLVQTLSHSKNAANEAWALLMTIENQLLATISGLSKVIESKQIAKTVSRTLKDYDHDAYMTYKKFR